MKLFVDEEFKNLIPPLSNDELKQLETNLKGGWESERGKIIVWNDTIVDGHNRYKICNENNIEFEVHKKDFTDRNEALLWIIDNQKGRRNMPDYARIKLELKRAEILRPKAKMQQLAGLKQYVHTALATLPKRTEIEKENAHTVIQISEKVLPTQKQEQAPRNKPLSVDEEKPLSVEPKPEPKPEVVEPIPEPAPKPKPINITKEVAKVTKKSADTVSKVKYISDHADADTEKKLMKGDKELSINKVYRDLKKADKRKQIVETFNEPQLPDTNKKYNIIYADPPWNFKHYSDKGKGRSPENHYMCQNLNDIKKLPISDLADKNCVLFMWVTFPFLEKGMEVLKAWGFEYKTVGFTWVKKNKKADTWFWGMGYYTRSNAEICIIATKGSIPRQSSSVHQIIDTPIEGHSKKPDVTRERIVELCGDIPRIELFAREKTDGWDSWGNEVNEE